METTLRPIEPPKKGWWKRHWPWVVPTGCLTMIVVVVLSCAGLFFYAFSMIKSSDVYKHSLQAARHNPQVIAALGQPIKPGSIVNGNFKVSGSTGHAEISYDIAGPHGGGTVHAIADKASGKWTFTTLEVNLKNTPRPINLLHRSAPPPALPNASPSTP